MIRALMRHIPGYTLPPGSDSWNVDQLLINFPMGYFAPIVVVQKENRLETYTKVHLLVFTYPIL